MGWLTLPPLAGDAHDTRVQQHFCWENDTAYQLRTIYALEFPSKQNESWEHSIFTPLSQRTRDLGYALSIPVQRHLYSTCGESRGDG